MTRVLVAGAGPTGLTAASLKILSPTGVAEAIKAEAIAFEAVRFHHCDRLVAKLPLHVDDRLRNWGMAQDRTEHHMIGGLARLGVVVRFGEELTAFDADETGITATLPGGDERFDILIGADAGNRDAPLWLFHDLCAASAPLFQGSGLTGRRRGTLYFSGWRARDEPWYQ